ncbi:NB-ARC domain protein [Schaalia georgiae F0490]|uniref:NB-ARC domain protein n=1 Tax=Schaalia georgiae F0490 TaxID=1125717 RepID=J0N4C4_9ACTO|nr:NB-ARC domain protein [Schaalia georgiae F0490]
MLARLRGQTNDKNHAVAKQIEKIVAGKVRGMYQKCRDQGVGTERLDGVATEIVRLVDQVAADNSLILEAVRFPDKFADLLHDLGDPIRATLFERSEPYFNELVDAMAGEYVRLAPWSPKFQIEALKNVMGALDRIEEGVDEVRAGVAKGLENDRVTHSELSTIRSEVSGLRDDLSAVSTGPRRPGRVLFGGRPDVAAGFIERGEQGRLRSLVIDERQGRTVLVGMAGCGKSQLASALAQWCEEAGWGVVAWVNAETKAAVKSDLVELANRLGIDTSDKPTENQVIGRCLDRLKSSALGDRIVVFDNVEDFEDLAGVVPQGAGLRVVATARSREASSAWEPVEVGVLPRPDSIDLVQSIMGTQDEKAADAVAERLGDLPLALAQAAETARIERWTLAEYLVRLEAFSSDRVIRCIPGDSYTDDVSIALLMATDSALGRIKGSLRGTARRQLGALAVLAESGVPTHWLDPRADADKTDKDTNARNDAADDANRALTALLNASVVRQTADGAVTMLHRLQAQVLRENWNNAEWTDAFDAAAGLLGQVNIDRLPRNNAEGRRRETLDLIDQLRAIAAQDYSHPLFEHERTLLPLLRVLEQAHSLELASAALDLATPVKLSLEHVEASSNAHFNILNYYALLCILGREVDGAIEQLTQLYNICHKQFGPTDEKTLGIEVNLAMAHASKDEYTTTLPRLRKVHRICERELGDRASVTLHARLNLASTLLSMGNHHESASLLKDRIRDYANVFGDCGIKTLAANHCLTLAYLEIENSQEVVNSIRANIERHKDTLGETHPRTLSTTCGLVMAYVSTDETSKAIQLGETLLKQSRQFLGRNNSVTLYASNNLASAYQEAGRLDEALTLFEDTLKASERTLGPDHPLTITVRENLKALEREMTPAPSSSPKSSEE